jgi:hypothetical protein
MEKIDAALTKHLRIRTISAPDCDEVPAGIAHAASALSEIGVSPCHLHPDTIKNAVFNHVSPNIRQARRNGWFLTGLGDAIPAVQAIDSSV